jgi:hypothetical protein
MNAFFAVLAIVAVFAVPIILGIDAASALKSIGQAVERDEGQGF